MCHVDRDVIASLFPSTETDISVDPESEDEESDEEMDIDAVDEKETQTVQGEDCEDHSFLQSIMESFVEKISFLKTRSGRAGLVHNFLRGLQLMSTPVPSGESMSSHHWTGLHMRSMLLQFLMEFGTRSSNSNHKIAHLVIFSTNIS